MISPKSFLSATTLPYQSTTIHYRGITKGLRPTGQFLYKNFAPLMQEPTELPGSPNDTARQYLCNTNKKLKIFNVKQDQLLCEIAVLIDKRTKKAEKYPATKQLTFKIHKEIACIIRISYGTATKFLS